uniref:Uncharacterized protein n=1 Tax=uncultured alpha proteobacterium HF0070_17D04 TaxID=710805 RepID=E0XSA8_9PROT|nr:hypothetical protein [uncultured alpha proteobacterium HF0070_17D04]
MSVFCTPFLLPVLLPFVRFLTRYFFKSCGKNPFHRGLVIVEHQFKEDLLTRAEVVNKT